MEVNLYGKGFVGSEFVKSFPDTVVNPRDSIMPQTPKILYTISTVDNYNVWDNPYLDINTNLSLLIKTLEACRLIYGSDFEFNFVSSWFVYGLTDYPAREDSHCNPKGFYSITKRCAEQLLVAYCETHGIKYRVLRLANVLGVNDQKVSKKKNYLQYAIQQLVDDKTVALYDGRLIRDFIDVRDAVEAINFVLERREINSIWNIGNGTPYSVEQILYNIHSRYETGKIGRIPVPEFHKQVQVADMYLDTTKLSSFGFRPKHNVYDTVREITNFYAHR